MCSLSPRATLFPYTTLFRSQVRSDGAGPGCAEVNVGRLPTHGGQQPCFVAFAWELVQLDARARSEEHTSELQSRFELVCRHLLEKKKSTNEHSASLCTLLPPLIQPAMRICLIRPAGYGHLSLPSMPATYFLPLTTPVSPAPTLKH